MTLEEHQNPETYTPQHSLPTSANGTGKGNKFVFPTPSDTGLHGPMNSSPIGAGHGMTNSPQDFEDTRSSRESLVSVLSSVGSTSSNFENGMENRQRSRKPRKRMNFRSGGNLRNHHAHTEAQRRGMVTCGRNRSSSAYSGRNSRNSSVGSVGSVYSSNDNIASNMGKYTGENPRDFNDNGRKTKNGMCAFSRGRLPPLHIPPPPLPPIGDGQNDCQSGIPWPHRRNSWGSFRDDDRMAHNENSGMNRHGHFDQQFRPNYRGKDTKYPLDVCGGIGGYNLPIPHSQVATHRNDSTLSSMMQNAKIQDPLVHEHQTRRLQKSSSKKTNQAANMHRKGSKCNEKQNFTNVQTSRHEQKVNTFNVVVNEGRVQKGEQSDQKGLSKPENFDPVKKYPHGLPNICAEKPGSPDSKKMLSTEVIRDEDSVRKKGLMLKDPIPNDCIDSFPDYPQHRFYQVDDSISKNTSPKSGPADRHESSIATEKCKRTSGELLNSQIEEEMARARQMSIPVNLDGDRKEPIEASTLNPEANAFSPTLEDGNGNEFFMVHSKNGMVYFHPRTPNDRSNPAYVVKTSAQGRSLTNEMVAQNDESDDENLTTAAFDSLSLHTNYDPNSLNVAPTDNLLTDKQSFSGEQSAPQMPVLPSCTGMTPSYCLTPQEEPHHYYSHNNAHSKVDPLSHPITVNQNGINSDNNTFGQYPQLFPELPNNHLAHFSPTPQQFPRFVYPQPQIGISPTFNTQENMTTVQNLNTTIPQHTLYQQPYHQQPPLPFAVPHPHAPPMLSLHPLTPMGFAPPPNSSLRRLGSSGAASPAAAPLSPFAPPVTNGYGQPNQNVPYVGPQPPIMNLQAYWATMDNSPSVPILPDDKNHSLLDQSTIMKSVRKDCDSFGLQTKKSRQNAKSPSKTIHQDEDFALKVITRFVKAVKHCEKTSDDPLSESEIIGKLLKQTTSTLFGVESRCSESSQTDGTIESEDDTKETAIQTVFLSEGYSYGRCNGISESESISQTSEESEDT